MRRLAGGDDVEVSVTEWQAGRIGGDEQDVGSAVRSALCQRDLLRIDINSHNMHAGRGGDEQRSGAVPAANVEVRPSRLNRQMAEAPHGGLRDAAAVPDIVDELLFESRHSHGASDG